MTAPPLFHLRQNSAPLLVSIPHTGTFLPPEIAERMTTVGRAVADTDWHVDQLYDFLPAMDATVIQATHSRYVVDLNRSPDGALLYPGRAETSVCPSESFAGEALYAEAPPDAAETASRVEAYWRPYHAALAAELARLHAMHGAVVLVDAHSIASTVPRLFEGRLPDLNFGTNDGASATAARVARMLAAADGSGFSQVLNGRFKGGYITRHYGRPQAGIDAVQIEIAQCAYLDEASPTVFDAARAARLREALKHILEAGEVRQV